MNNFITFVLQLVNMKNLNPCSSALSFRNNPVTNGLPLRSGRVFFMEKHGNRYIHGNSHTKIYHVWGSLYNRCYNPKNPRFKNYGGRGITVCEEWKNDFMSFRDWSMQNGYADNLQIDRRENDGNYEPGNCRWVTNMINTQNTRLLRIRNTTGYRGIFKNDRGTYGCQIMNNGKKYCLGIHKTPEAAARAYDNMVIKNGWNHPLNFPERKNPERKELSYRESMPVIDFQGQLTIPIIFNPLNPKQ